MKYKHLAFYLAAVVLSAGCLDLNPEKPSADDKKPPEEMDNVLHSDAYKAPVFTDPERIQKIKAAWPEAEKVFRDYAEKNHYPGYVYGIVA
ncbi:MAG: hypothetical protein KDD12_26485, partial [Lewinella sp.]|nr:hypothetical protein [Lewinella sp.]